MAYLDTPPLRQRLASLGAAGAIELAIAAVIVVGLSTKFVPVVNTPQIWGRNIPDDPPPPPPPPQPKRSSQPDESKVTAPDTTIKINPNGGDLPVDDDLTPAGDVIDIPRDPPPYVPPPRFEPVAARPSNNTSRWVTTDDYPSRDLREGNQGTAKFRVIVGSNGRVQACEVTQSSGFAGLDRATCTYVTRRARFEAATDETGGKVVGSYSGSVVWRIP